MLGQPIDILIPERLQADHRALMHEFITAPADRFMDLGREVCGRRRDGTEIPPEVGLSSIQSGRKNAKLLDTHLPPDPDAVQLRVYATTSTYKSRPLSVPVRRHESPLKADACLLSARDSLQIHEVASCPPMNHPFSPPRRRSGPLATLLVTWFLASSGHAQASMFHGETLDSIANAISWVVLIIAPLVGLTVFWLVHILPEKIAHKKKHPQTGAIQCLCLLSLCFGGLLWPIAWLWAYTKPVLHKLAYGTDVDESLAHHDPHKAQPVETPSEKGEIEKLRMRVLELEAKLTPKGGKA